MDALLVFCFSLSILSASALVALKPSSGAIFVCVGQVREFTCTSNSSNLEWGISGSLPVVFFSENDTPQRTLRSFQIQLVGVLGSNFTSIATVNVTDALNGTTLQCGDAGLTETETVTFTVQGISNISFICLERLSDNEALLSWAGGVCICYYEVQVNDTTVANLEETEHIINTTAFGVSNVAVTGFDCLGRPVNTVRMNFTKSAQMNDTTSLSPTSTVCPTRTIVTSVCSSTVCPPTSTVCSCTPTPTCSSSCCIPWIAGFSVLVIIIGGMMICCGITLLVRVCWKEWFRGWKCWEKQCWDKIWCERKGSHQDSKRTDELLVPLTDDEITNLFKSELSKRPVVAKAFEATTSTTQAFEVTKSTTQMGTELYAN